jgi:hypothetical protein
MRHLPQPSPGGARKPDAQRASQCATRRNS